VRLGAVEQQLFELRQLRGAELRLASGATGMPQRLDASLRCLLRPATDALLSDTEAAGHLRLVETLIEQAQGLQSTPFQRLEIASDSSGIPHAYKTSGMKKGYLILCESQ
jgi:hypothetical protein